MNKRYNKQKNFLIILILSTLFLFISSVSFYIYTIQKEHLYTDHNNKVKIETNLLGNYLADLLIRHDYAELKNYLNKVVKNNKTIAYLELTLENKKTLFLYKTDAKSSGVKKTFQYGNKSFDLAIYHEIIKLDNYLTKLKIILMGFIVIFTIISGYTLWYILSRWILKPLNIQIEEKTKKIENYSRYLNNIINSISSHIAIVNNKGVIERTNDAWKDFAQSNGYTGEPSMIGINYLQQCDLNNPNDCKNGFEKGVIEVISGKADHFLGTYECHSTKEKRWFNIRANRFYSNGNPYTIISHENITNIKEIQAQLEKVNRLFSSLSQSNMALLESKEEQQLLDNVVDIICSNSHYVLVWIGYKIDNEEKNVKIMSSAGVEKKYLENIIIKWSDCDHGKGPTGTAIRESKTVIVNDINSDFCFKPWRDKALEKGFQSSAAFPICNGDTLFGALNIYSDKKDSFIEEEIKLLEKLARNLAYGIISLRDKKKIEQLSITDQLTGIFNRRKIDEVMGAEIQRYRRYKEPLCMMILDIDHFKAVNDTYGHQAGDSVLVEFTNVVSHTIRDTDIFGRWGGEEFIVILPNTNIQNAQLLANRIRSDIEQYRFTTVNRKTVSIGLSLFLQSDTSDTIIERVDRALYEAKEKGRNKVVVF